MVHRNSLAPALFMLVLLAVTAPAARTAPVYVELGRDSILSTPGQTIPIDIDANGTVDFVMYCNSLVGNTFMGVDIPTLLQLTNKVAVTGTLNTLGNEQARPNDPSTPISGSLTFNGLIVGNGPVIAQPSLAGPDIFEGKGEQYIGVSFDRNGAQHYGWIRVSVNAAGDTARISAYAYESLPGVGISTGNPAPVAVQQINVHGSGGASAIVTNGGSLQMVADVLPADAANKNVAWSVNNTATATIDAGGLLQAHANGAVTVTATATDGSGVSGSTTVMVSNQTPTVLVNRITVRSLNGQTAISTPGGTLAMTADVEPANASNKTVIWSVDNNASAMVDANGILRAHADGSVTVRATAADGSGMSGSTVVTISGQNPVVTVGRITVRSATGDTMITTAGGTLAMMVDVEPANATNKAVTWSVDNGAAAMIDASGMLVAMGNGRATVTATAVDGSNVSGSLGITITGQAAAAVTGLMPADGDAPKVSVRGDLLTIELPRGGFEPLSVSIYDVIGRSVAQHASDGTGRMMLIDCSSLPAGMYLITGTSAGTTFAERMVLAR